MIFFYFFYILIQNRAKLFLSRFSVCNILSENILQTYFLLRQSTEENDCIIQIRNGKLMT